MMYELTNNYLSKEALAGFSIKKLFLQPYKEGVNNIARSLRLTAFIHSQKPSIQSQSESLGQRIQLGCAGLFLLIPIINTISLIALRRFNKKTPFNPVKLTFLDPSKKPKEVEISKQERPLPSPICPSLSQPEESCSSAQKTAQRQQDVKKAKQALLVREEEQFELTEEDLSFLQGTSSEKPLAEEVCSSLALDYTIPLQKIAMQLISNAEEMAIVTGQSTKEMIKEAIRSLSLDSKEKNGFEISPNEQAQQNLEKIALHFLVDVNRLLAIAKAEALLNHTPIMQEVEKRLSLLDLSIKEELQLQEQLFQEVISYKIHRLFDSDHSVASKRNDLLKNLSKEINHFTPLPVLRKEWQKSIKILFLKALLNHFAYHYLCGDKNPLKENRITVTKFLEEKIALFDESANLTWYRERLLELYLKTQINHFKELQAQKVLFDPKAWLHFEKVIAIDFFHSATFSIDTLLESLKNAAEADKDFKEVSAQVCNDLKLFFQSLCTPEAVVDFIEKKAVRSSKPCIYHLQQWLYSFPLLQQEKLEIENNVIKDLIKKEADYFLNLSIEEEKELDPLCFISEITEEIDALNQSRQQKERWLKKAKSFYLDCFYEKFTKEKKVIAQNLAPNQPISFMHFFQARMALFDRSTSSNNYRLALLKTYLKKYLDKVMKNVQESTKVLTLKDAQALRASLQVDFPSFKLSSLQESTELAYLFTEMKEKEQSLSKKVKEMEMDLKDIRLLIESTQARFLAKNDALTLVEYHLHSSLNLSQNQKDEHFFQRNQLAQQVDVIKKHLNELRKKERREKLAFDKVDQAQQKVSCRTLILHHLMNF